MSEVNGLKLTPDEGFAKSTYNEAKALYEKLKKCYNGRPPLLPPPRTVQAMSHGPHRYTVIDSETIWRYRKALIECQKKRKNKKKRGKRK